MRLCVSCACVWPVRWGGCRVCARPPGCVCPGLGLLRASFAPFAVVCGDWVLTCFGLVCSCCRACGWCLGCRCFEVLVGLRFGTHHCALVPWCPVVPCLLVPVWRCPVVSVFRARCPAREGRFLGCQGLSEARSCVTTLSMGVDSLGPRSPVHVESSAGRATWRGAPWARRSRSCWPAVAPAHSTPSLGRAGGGRSPAPVCGAVR